MRVSALAQYVKATTEYILLFAESVRDLEGRLPCATACQFAYFISHSIWPTAPMVVLEAGTDGFYCFC
jgi:hypothetical protein